VTKPFSNLLNQKKDGDSSSAQSIPKEVEKVKSIPLIIFGLIISLASIFLLLFTIKNKFG